MTIEKYRPRCFVDIEINGQNVGRVIIELFSDICPLTSENFRALCTGEKGIGKVSGQPLHYKGVPFHRIIKNFMVQSGDFIAGNGTGGESIYGGTFKDENFQLAHDKPYLLSMANRGPDTNGSQFFITTQPSPHLDGKHTVFGHVISGFEVVAKLESESVDSNSKPVREIKINNCGELVLKAKPKILKKRQKQSGSEFSESEDSDDKERRRKKRHLKQEKKFKEEKKEKLESSILKPAKYDEATESTVIPAEIPEVPVNNFLLRRSPRPMGDRSRRPPRRDNEPYYSKRPPVSRSGRKIKGRGFMRYRTPSPENSRSGSETPPHWKQAQARVCSIKEVMKKQQSVKEEPKTESDSEEGEIDERSERISANLQDEINEDRFSREERRRNRDSNYEMPREREPVKPRKFFRKNDYRRNDDEDNKNDGEKDSYPRSMVVKASLGTRMRLNDRENPERHRRFDRSESRNSLRKSYSSRRSNQGEHSQADCLKHESKDNSSKMKPKNISKSTTVGKVWSKMSSLEKMVGKYGGLAPSDDDEEEENRPRKKEVEPKSQSTVTVSDKDKSENISTFNKVMIKQEVDFDNENNKPQESPSFNAEHSDTSMDRSDTFTTKDQDLNSSSRLQPTTTNATADDNFSNNAMDARICSYAESGEDSSVVPGTVSKQLTDLHPSQEKNFRNAFFVPNETFQEPEQIKIPLIEETDGPPGVDSYNPNQVNIPFIGDAGNFSEHTEDNSVSSQNITKEDDSERFGSNVSASLHDSNDVKNIKNLYVSDNSQNSAKQQEIPFLEKNNNELHHSEFINSPYVIPLPDEPKQAIPKTRSIENISPMISQLPVSDKIAENKASEILPSIKIKTELSSFEQQENVIEPRYSGHTFQETLEKDVDPKNLEKTSSSQRRARSHDRSRSPKLKGRQGKPRSRSKSRSPIRRRSLSTSRDRKLSSRRKSRSPAKRKSRSRSADNRKTLPKRRSRSPIRRRSRSHSPAGRSKSRSRSPVRRRGRYSRSPDRRSYRRPYDRGPRFSNYSRVRNRSPDRRDRLYRRGRDNRSRSRSHSRSDIEKKQRRRNRKSSTSSSSSSSSSSHHDKSNRKTKRSQRNRSSSSSSSSRSRSSSP